MNVYEMIYKFDIKFRKPGRGFEIIEDKITTENLTLLD